mgnify:CR=1 FL=1
MSIAGIPYIVSKSELLLYGGITVMSVTIILAIISIVIFILTGWKIKNRLEKDYGELEKYK